MRLTLILLLVAWAIAFFGSFIAFYLTPATDFGLAAGWNKVGVFMIWQAVATVLAMLCLILRWTTDMRRLRRWAAVPAIALSVLVICFVGLYFWASLQRSAQPPDPALTPSAPQTAPVDG